MLSASVGLSSTGLNALLVVCSHSGSFRPHSEALSLSLSCKDVAVRLQRPSRLISWARSTSAVHAVVDKVSRPLHEANPPTRGGAASSLLHEVLSPAALEHGTSLQQLQSLINRAGEYPTMGPTTAAEANDLLSGDVPLMMLCSSCMQRLFSHRPPGD
jgi:hypothetical protein